VVSLVAAICLLTGLSLLLRVALVLANWLTAVWLRVPTAMRRTFRF
jgi:hypothetical protein